MPPNDHFDFPQAFHFGEYSLDPTRNVVTFRGQPLKIQRQPFLVLHLLLQRAPAIVSREELSQHVWGDGVHVDLDQGLNFCVRQVRLVLNDNASAPRFVETLPRQGYRFLMPVQREAPEIELDAADLTVPEPSLEEERLSPPSEPPAVNPSATPRTSRRTLLYLIAAVSAAGAAASVSRLLRSRHPPGTINVVLPMPFGAAAADPGRLLGPPAISPDGTAVVVSLKTNEGNYLYIRRLNSNRLVRLDGTLGVTYPFWSPDSIYIGFFADGKLKRIPAAGGSPVTLCDAAGARGGSWGKSGIILFGLNFQGLFAVADKGGAVRPITQLDHATAENSHRYPVFLPDGQRFLYFARADNLDQRGIFIGSLNGHEPRRRVLVADGQFAFGLDPDSGKHHLFTQQSGKIVAQPFNLVDATIEMQTQEISDQAGTISVSDTGVLVLRTESTDQCSLTWFDRTGHELGTIGPVDDYWGMDLSPDDRTVAVVRHDYLNGVFTIWTASAPNGPMEPLSAALHAHHLLWSPDSKRVFYSDWRDHQLFVRTLKPRGPEESVLDLAPNTTILDVSADQRFISAKFYEANGHTRVVWAELDPPGLSATPPQPKRFLDASLKRGTPWHQVDAFGSDGLLATFSPAGRWLAVTSNHTGRSEVYLIDFQSEQNLIRVSDRGGFGPQWRRDGRELFYIASDGTMTAVQLSAVDGTLNLGTPETLFPTMLRTPGEGPDFDVTSDGQRFLLNQSSDKRHESDIQLIINWPGLLPT